MKYSFDDSQGRVFIIIPSDQFGTQMWQMRNVVCRLYAQANKDIQPCWSEMYETHFKVEIPSRQAGLALVELLQQWLQENVVEPEVKHAAWLEEQRAARIQAHLKIYRRRQIGVIVVIAMIAAIYIAWKLPF